MIGVVQGIVGSYKNSFYIFCVVDQFHPFFQTQSIADGTQRISVGGEIGNDGDF